LLLFVETLVRQRRMSVFFVRIVACGANTKKQKMDFDVLEVLNMQRK
jgi:hypothetical protein